MLPLFLVDAFADRPFTGNPAAVVPLSAPADEQWMQLVAMEMNQAETAFFWPEADGFRLRWFTPAVEVDLCGHATLASAHVIWTELGHAGVSIHFHTRSGTLVCSRRGDEIVMDFPAEPPTESELSDLMAASLPVAPVWVGKNRMDHFVVLPSVEDILETDWSQYIPEIEKLGLRGLIVTAQGGTNADFTSRGFFPQAGIPEDPVTGSAHCALAPYWAEQLGKSMLVGHQASARGGWVGCEVTGDRVFLSGRAQTVVKGSLLA